jgi:hypothetical protein
MLCGFWGRCDDNCTSAGCDAVDPGETSGTATQPDTREIISTEDSVFFDGTGSYDDALRVDEVQAIRCGDRDERPFVDPDRGGMLEERDVT